MQSRSEELHCRKPEATLQPFTLSPPSDCQAQKLPKLDLAADRHAGSPNRIAIPEWAGPGWAQELWEGPQGASPRMILPRLCIQNASATAWPRQGLHINQPAGTVSLAQLERRRSNSQSHASFMQPCLGQWIQTIRSALQLTLGNSNSPVAHTNAGTLGAQRIWSWLQAKCTCPRHGSFQEDWRRSPCFWRICSHSCLNDPSQSHQLKLTNGCQLRMLTTCRQQI